MVLRSQHFRPNFTKTLTWQIVSSSWLPITFIWTYNLVFTTWSLQDHNVVTKCSENNCGWKFSQSYLLTRMTALMRLLVRLNSSSPHSWSFRSTSTISSWSLACLLAEVALLFFLWSWLYHRESCQVFCAFSPRRASFQ